MYDVCVHCGIVNLQDNSITKERVQIVSIPPPPFNAEGPVPYLSLVVPHIFCFVVFAHLARKVTQ